MPFQGLRKPQALPGPDLLFLFAAEAKLAAIGPARNGLGQQQLTAVLLGNGMVAAHGNVSQALYLLVCAALFLPCLHQRAIMEIEIQRVVRHPAHLYLEHHARGQGKQRFLQCV